MAVHRLAGQVQSLLNENFSTTTFIILAALAVLVYTTRWYWSHSPLSLPLDAEEAASLAAALNPPILRKNSTTECYVTSYATYPGIRTFYYGHPQAEKLPDAGKELPLLVFIHGLGGSLAQFGPLLNSLINIAPCFGIDMPGCGLSSSAMKSYTAYTTEALAALHKVAIQQCCERYGHSHVVLLGHSMGCSISALLVSNTTRAEIKLAVNTMGMVAICPKSAPPTQSEVKTYRRLLLLPDFVINLVRWLDRRGGTESTSVTRFVGKDAGIDLKMLQLRFNSQFPTSVWKRTLLGAIPKYSSEAEGKGGLPGGRIWCGVDTPLFMIAGAGDTICTPEELTNIVSYLHGQGSTQSSNMQSEPVPTAAENLLDGHEIPPSGRRTTSDDTKAGVLPSTFTSESQHAAIIQTAILPHPASHALLYDHSFYRTVAGLVEDFLSTQVSPHLNLGWQLQTLTKSGKWDVKNLAKWQKTEPISDLIDDGRFRALKTLREQDEVHTPFVFVQKWKDKIYCVIDISHDTPNYDTSNLEKGGIQYHKFATVSKVPPTVTEVADFIALIERLRKELHEKEDAGEARQAIGVHCHYGFNRTGFFLVSYLVEKRGFTLRDAIEEFKRARPPGIRHDHFLDTLFVRYCVGLSKAS